MRTLLRHIPSGLYFQGPDQWTSNPDQAFDFKMVTRALTFLEKTGLEEMEVAFAYDNPGVTAVPINHFSAGLSSSRLDPVLAALVASGCAGRRPSR
jgi:hypothetical protein